MSVSIESLQPRETIQNRLISGHSTREQLALGISLAGVPQAWLSILCGLEHMYAESKRLCFQCDSFESGFAAFFFWGIERILALSTPRHWVISKFKAAGKVDSKDLDRLFWQAGSRVVGMVHLLVQVSVSFESLPHCITESISKNLIVAAWRSTILRADKKSANVEVSHLVCLNLRKCLPHLTW